MAHKYLYNNAGAVTEREAATSSSGAGDAGKIVALDTGGKLDNSLLPTGVGEETKTLVASEALTGGDWVNVFDDSGTTKCRKADATGPGAGKRAHGFVLAAVDSGSNATIYVQGINNQVSGLTGGSQYFLATTAGGETTTAPSATGNIVQELGVALSATEVAFWPSNPIVLA